MPHNQGPLQVTNGAEPPKKEKNYLPLVQQKLTFPMCVFPSFYDRLQSQTGVVTTPTTTYGGVSPPTSNSKLAQQNPAEAKLCQVSHM